MMLSESVDTGVAVLQSSSSFLSWTETEFIPPIMETLKGLLSHVEYQCEHVAVIFMHKMLVKEKTWRLGLTNDRIQAALR